MDRHESMFEQMILADRSGREIKGWKGRFVDYLDLVKKDPGLAKFSHARIYDVILKSGISATSDSGDSRTKRIFKDR
jgi:serine protein kinase